MKANEKFLVALEDEATSQIGEIRAFRTYKGQNPEYHHRAKVAIGVIGAFVRLLATIENRRYNDRACDRLVTTVEPKQIA